MRIKLLSIGEQMPAWMQTGFKEYQKRLPKHIEFQLTEIANPKLSKNSANIEKQKLVESELFKKRIQLGDHVIALDQSGTKISTNCIAKKLNQWQMSGAKPVLLIGGSHGLANSCLEDANECWSLSEMTFPHMLARVIIAEQLYRAWSINAKHPYHK